METVDSKPISPELVDDKPQMISADLRKFNRSEQMIQAAISTLALITAINDHSDCELALGVLKEAKTVESKVEEKRVELKKPFLDAGKKIDSYVKDLVSKLPLEIERVKKVVLKFQKSEEERKARLRKEKREEQLKQMGMAEGSGRYTYQSLIVDDYMIVHFSEEQWIQLTGQVAMDISNHRQRQLEQKKNDLDVAEFFGSPEEAGQLKEEIEALQRPDVSFPVSIASAEEATKVKGVTKRWAFEIMDETQVPHEYLTVDEKKIREAIAAGTRCISGVRIFQQESLTIR
jgi:hypothetical protein